MLAPRVLLADDDPHLVHLVRQKLASTGIRLSVARNGEDALRMATYDPPDMVVLDVNMPLMGGLDVLAQLRRQPALDDKPIMMLTGVRDESAVRNAIEGGASDFLAKPFRPDVFLARIYRHLRLTPPPIRNVLL